MRIGGSARAKWLAASLGLLTSPAAAVETEPDGRQVPLPLTADIQPAVIACCAVLPDGSNMSLEALFQSRGESIDWQDDATLEPQYFAPGCGLRGSLVLRGEGCSVDFGWYNVDLNSPNSPAASSVYPLVGIADLPAWFEANGLPPNNANAFRPAVGDPPVEGAVIGNLRTDPRYLGGLVALATLGNDLQGVCTQPHYSEPRLNQMSVFGEPWIMALVYPSTVAANSFYIAFEALPTDPDNFAKVTPQGYQNDADFNDLVYFVEGVACEGGGQACLTSAEGVCALGVTVCASDGFVQCAAQNQPEPEVCDRLDNDCNGVIDDGELCPAGEVCDQGVCRADCAAGEFECPAGTACIASTGRCEDPRCADVTCEAGQVCQAGICRDGCAGVICPMGQFCQLGQCVDPCAGRGPDGPAPCPANTACEGGICMESCECRMCGPGMECDLSTDQCVAAGCTGVTCDEGFTCMAGTCVSACSNVICPGTQTCVDGSCRLSGGAGGSPGSGGSAGGGAAGSGGSPGAGGTVSSVGGASASAGAPPAGVGGVSPDSAGSAGVVNGGATSVSMVCTPGEKTACECPGGGEGVQMCATDGSGLEECTGCPGVDQTEETATVGSSTGGCGCKTAPSRSLSVGLLGLVVGVLAGMRRRRTRATDLRRAGG